MQIGVHRGGLISRPAWMHYMVMQIGMLDHLAPYILDTIYSIHNTFTVTNLYFIIIIIVAWPEMGKIFQKINPCTVKKRGLILNPTTIWLRLHPHVLYTHIRFKRRFKSPKV